MRVGIIFLGLIASSVSLGEFSTAFVRCSGEVSKSIDHVGNMNGVAHEQTIIDWKKQMFLEVQHEGSMVAWALALLPHSRKALGSNLAVCLEFICSTHVCVGFL